MLPKARKLSVKTIIDAKKILFIVNSFLCAETNTPGPLSPGGLIPGFAVGDY